MVRPSKSLKTSFPCFPTWLAQPQPLFPTLRPPPQALGTTADAESPPVSIPQPEETTSKAQLAGYSSGNHPARLSGYEASELAFCQIRPAGLINTALPSERLIYDGNRQHFYNWLLVRDLSTLESNQDRTNYFGFPVKIPSRAT